MYNFILDASYVTVVSIGIRYVVGAEGIRFGWDLVKTIARLAVNK